MILPGGAIGILGGGQLGRMLAVPARQLGYSVNVLAPLGDAPALGLADHAIRASFADSGAARQLASLSDVVTYEFENVPAATARAAAELRPLFPSVELLETTQDRNVEHAFLDRLGIATAPGRVVVDSASLDAAITALGLPARLKSARGGYYGGGQLRLSDPATVREAHALVARAGVQWRLEAEVPFEREVSVLVARSAAGEVVVYPPFENEHQDGILRVTTWPATGSPHALQRAEAIARAVAEAMDLVGLMCVECFVQGDDVRVNELAPRVHNSGHLTIEGASISQFEMHVRAICGLPLLPPLPTAAGVVMVNLLGAEERKHARLVGCEVAMREPGVHVHLYGKDRERPRRKMGHVTVTGASAADARERALRAASALSFG